MNVNKMKMLSVFALTGVLAVVSTGVGADSGGDIIEVPVISSNPVYTTVRINTPQQECWQEAVSVPTRQSKSRTPEILGAIVGAGVGRMFGSGRGQDVATVAGAVLGGSIGRDQSNRNAQHNNRVHYEQRCRMVDQYRTEERLEWYDVTYKYNGLLYNARTNHDPGSSIKVSVMVVPVE